MKQIFRSAIWMIAIFAIASASAAFAQDSGVASTPTVQLSVSAADRAAAANPVSYRYRIDPINRDVVPPSSLTGPEPLSALTNPSAQLPLIVQRPFVGFYPADLSYFGGSVVVSAQYHNIYVGSANEAPWGDPEGFEINLGKSRMIHIADQYVRSAKPNRYTDGGNYSISSVASFCTTATFCSFNDILGIVHAAAVQQGANGYGHIFHVFLPPGVDTCDSTGTACYSPDNPPTWVFCAYHQGVVFSDIGETLFSVEPFQNVNLPPYGGCQVINGTPNGQLADSTNSVLSHETFETITDPDPGSGWMANSSRAEAGSEIGDICAGMFDANTDVIVPTVVLFKTKYAIQTEYDNHRHECSVLP